MEDAAQTGPAGSSRPADRGWSSALIPWRALGPPLAAGMALRLWWIFHFGQTTEDTRVYGEFARNLIQHHVYGWDTILNGVTRPPQPTLIRLPGYPLFLAACFLIFGVQNYTAVMLVQACVDLGTCLLLCGITERLFTPRAGRAALWMAVLCPFLANYVAAALTETLTLFCIALGFYALLRWRERPGVNRWIYVLSFALAYAILLRPEQGMLAACVVPAMWWHGGPSLQRRARPLVLVCALTLLPLAPWAARNWHVFHVFQPLAPRFATDPGEFNPYGFQRWYRTWAIDFASTVNVYWNFGGAPVRIGDLPVRAFDSQAQYDDTQALMAVYNATDNPTPALDAGFQELATQRIHTHPLRYFVVLPVARVADMMLRPRTEMLPVPLEWWRFAPPRRADFFALLYATLNLGFFVLAGVGFARRQWKRAQRAVVYAMVATIVLRAGLLLTLDNSEARYTLEFYPVLLVLGSVVVANCFRSTLQRDKEMLAAAE